MCGRFALVSDAAAISEKFAVRGSSYEFEPNWNVTPGQHIGAVIRRAGKNYLVPLLWGLIPSTAKDPSIGKRLINARAETINVKPSFRSAFSKRRCLIVADGFYEWKKEGTKKTPLYFHLKSKEPFGLAGLYETWTSPDKKEIRSCTIITTEANRLIAPVHDRMPVIMPKKEEQVWLGDIMEDRAMLLSILKPYPADEMGYQIGMGPRFAEVKEGL
ncbi:MAG: SOS response-associated peptidase [Syntrophales bacterium]|jgi:putative SOS response-associated peptidase YedK